MIRNSGLDPVELKKSIVIGYCCTAIGGVAILENNFGENHRIAVHIGYDTDNAPALRFQQCVTLPHSKVGLNERKYLAALAKRGSPLGKLLVVGMAACEIPCGSWVKSVVLNCKKLLTHLLRHLVTTPISTLRCQPHGSDSQCRKLSLLTGARVATSFLAEIFPPPDENPLLQSCI